VAIGAAPVALAQREKLPPDDLEYVEKTWPEAKKTVTGIRYIVLQQGEGEPARRGDKAMVLYVGRLLDGKVFDKAQDRNKPFPVFVRSNDVIEGWDQILQDMRKGEKRLVIIPAELGYGTRGQPPQIPRNATLVFEMEIVDIIRTEPRASTGK
jgi:FKBP-type peptidyl-prolyl cis-trans isomerase